MIDVDGRRDPTPAVLEWVVDSLTPRTTLFGMGVSETRSREAEFTFTADRSGTTFECRVDEGPGTRARHPFAWPASPRARTACR